MKEAQVMETSLFSCPKHTGPMPFLGRPNHHDVKGYGICVLYVDNAMAIMATMSDGRVDKNEVCLQFCLVYYLSLSDIVGCLVKVHTWLFCYFEISEFESLRTCKKCTQS